MLDWLQTTRRLLNTRYVGRAMEGHAVLDSTNARALAWAHDGARAGAVVVADQQTAGKGRLGRYWQGGQSLSLLFSVVARPAVEDERFGLIPLVAGLAVVDAVQPVVGESAVQLKWPNDLLVNGRKSAGILVESVMVTGGVPKSRCAVIGIGINVNQEVMPRELEATAISLRQATGAVVPRPILLAHLLEALEDRLDQLEDDAEGVIRAYSDRLAGVNQPVSLSRPDGGQVHGTSLGIDGSGALCILTENGERSVFTAGEVTQSPRTP
jgi:BirA family transcriptional regulator, biotin operon repressor / biotin---[acetyl-CoA-carboxylase] ligase